MPKFFLRLLITLSSICCLTLVFLPSSNFSQESSESKPNPVPQLNPNEQNLLDAHQKVIEILSSLPEDTPIEISLGSSHPILRPGDQTMSSDRDSKTPEYAIGFIDKNGQPHYFRPGMLLQMLQVSAGSSGNLSLLPAGTEDINSQVPKGRIPVLDLIVRRSSDGRIFIVRRVNANALVRDVLNGFLTNTWKKGSGI